MTNYMVCNDNNTNRFLSYFDKLPLEIGELILSNLTGHTMVLKLTSSSQPLIY